jgi:Endonuclease NucS
MPIHHAIWRIGEQPAPLVMSRMANEQHLEDMIVRDPRILSNEWMVIGRQEITSHGGRVDLLAIAPDGSLVVIELKRDRTARETVAQALDYASWVEQLGPEKIAQIYQRFSNGGSLDEAFRQRFGVELDEETLNQSHQIVVVAAELDPSTERIITYLNAREIAINVLFFQVFEHGAPLRQTSCRPHFLADDPRWSDKTCKEIDGLQSSKNKH